MTRTSSIVFWFGLVIIASIAFYHTTDNVQGLEQKLRSIDASIENEQQSIHVLKAEWVYLSNPTRVEAESKKHLAVLRPTATTQVAKLGDMTDMLPTREEAMVNVAVNSTPVASVKTTLTAPAIIAAAAPRPVKTASMKKLKNVIAVASADTGHLSDHMIIQHTASPPSTDVIGALITELGAHP